MIPIRSPRWTQNLFPELVWRIDTEEKNLYITFDDGPIPEVTPWVLDLLASYGAQATFFCIGDNVIKYPEIYARIIKEGHRVGHHTQNHLNSWKSTDKQYYRNVLAGNETAPSSLFRPPYGKIKKGQIKVLNKRFSLVLWTILSKDYNKEVTPAQCLQNVLQCKAGDIIVFHDSKKAKKNMEHALNGFLNYYSNEGYKFLTLPDKL